jgi:hypothetical protein
MWRWSQRKVNQEDSVKESKKEKAEKRAGRRGGGTPAYRNGI